MNPAYTRDTGFGLDAVKASDRVATLNSGDAGAEAANNGTQIDRLALTRHRLSAAICVPYKATLQAGKTLTSLKVKLQHRSSTSGAGSTWADYTAALGGSTGSVSKTTTGVGNDILQHNIDCSGAKRYVRTVVTADFQATTTGSTLDIDAVVAVFGPGQENPL